MMAQTQLYVLPMIVNATRGVGLLRTDICRGKAEDHAEYSNFLNRSWKVRGLVTTIIRFFPRIHPAWLVVCGSILMDRKRNPCVELPRISKPNRPASLLDRGRSSWTAWPGRPVYGLVVYHLPN